MGIKRIILYYNLFGPKGLWFWLATKIGLIKKPLPAMAHFASFSSPFYIRLNTSDIKVFQHVVQEDEYYVTLRQHPKIIIDAGANIGLTSIVFANRYPQARIFAIEPEQSNFALLCKNAAPYTNIVPIQAALWNLNTDITLVDPGLDKWGFQVSNCCDTSTSRREYIKAITLDSLLANQHIETIDILKIDIEGAEKEVFDSSESWIGKVNIIIVELHDRIKDGCRESLERATTDFSYRRNISDCNLLLAREEKLVTSY